MTAEVEVELAVEIARAALAQVRDDLTREEARELVGLFSASLPLLIHERPQPPAGRAGHDARRGALERSGHRAALDLAAYARGGAPWPPFAAAYAGAADQEPRDTPAAVRKRLGAG